MKRLARALAAALLMVPAACGSDEPTGGSPTPPASPASQECTPPKGGGDAFLVLTAVRVGTHAGYDRVTFEFKEPARPPASPAPAGMLPRYELNRVTSVTEDGSGASVQVDGKQLQQIVFHGASGADLTTDTPVITYTGPKEFKPNFKILAELERTGDFEATLSWALGLKEVRCLKVVELRNPTRLAIDLPH